MKRSYLRPEITTPTAGQVSLYNILAGQQENDAAIGRLHDLVRIHMVGPNFACVLGKRAMVRGLYRIGFYDSMHDPSCIQGLCNDLWQFVSDQPGMKTPHPEDYSTFIAVFRTPLPNDEVEHEKDLWNLLQNLHDEDAGTYPWAANVKSDPNDPDFSFSIGTKAFFLVGLHGSSSRTSRRLQYPAIAFNSHDQFSDLRARNRFASVQQTIRNQDMKIQGSINPSLSNYGTDSEAKQYSGRLVEPTWKCPFKP